jgi:hypothetical protein
MEEKDNEELLKALKELESKVSALSGPYEDALANRVFQKSQEQFKRWIGLWVAVVTIGVGFLGYKGYSDIVESGSKKASEFVSQRAQPALEERINSEVSKAVNEAKEGLRKQTDRDIASSLSSIKPTENSTQNVRAYVVATYFKKLNGDSQPSPGDILLSLSPVNLRKDANINAPIVGVIDRGARVKLINKVGNGEEQWYEVESLQ